MIDHTLTALDEANLTVERLKMALAFFSDYQAAYLQGSAEKLRAAWTLTPEHPQTLSCVLEDLLIDALAQAEDTALKIAEGDGNE